MCAKTREKGTLKRNARQERDTAAGQPGRLRPKIQTSKKRAHPNTDPRKSARRNRGKYPETRNRLKNPCRTAKAIPHINRPASLMTNYLHIYLSREK